MTKDKEAPAIENKVCCKCGYVWKAKTENPKECPSCKSRTWDQKPKED